LPTVQICLHSDCYLFKNLKSFLRGTRFADDESPKAVVEALFEGQDGKFLFSRHKQLTRKVAKCIDVAREYTEK